MADLGFVVVEWAGRDANRPGARLTIHPTPEAAATEARHATDRADANKWGHRYTIARIEEVTT